MRNLQDENTEKKDKFIEVGKRVLFPPTVVIFLLFNITLVGLLFIFLNHLETNPLAAGFYAVAFYSLVIVCARIPGIVKKINSRLHSNKYTHRYITDGELRIVVSLYIGLAVNILFAAFKIAMGVLYNSAWLYAMAGYNTILTIMRFVVFREQKKGNALRCAEVCGWLMLVLNIAISVIMYMVIVMKQPIVYHEIVVIALAAYTFYCFTMAIINVIKYRKKNPIYFTIKRIDLVKAIVSIFTMQVAMLTQYGGTDGFDTGLMNTLTGIAVTIAVNTIAALMLARVYKDKNKAKHSM